MGTCKWGDCRKAAIAWRFDDDSGSWVPVCIDHADYHAPTLDPPGPEHGSPEWHLEQAEQHLAKADELAGKHQTELAAGRLLAASANAQVAAVKLAIASDAMLADLLGQLRQLNTHAEFVATEVDRLDLPRRG